MRKIPIWLATQLGEMAFKRRTLAFVYVVTVFFVVPLTESFMTRDVEFTHEVPIPRSLRDSGYVAPEDTLQPRVPDSSDLP